jgi:threonine dehydrogenase-like Zn-dependent dehydrogenase
MKEWFARVSLSITMIVSPRKTHAWCPFVIFLRLISNLSVIQKELEQLHRHYNIFLSCPSLLTMGSSNDDAIAGTAAADIFTMNDDTMLAFVIENAGDKHGKVVRMPKPTPVPLGKGKKNGTASKPEDTACALIRVLRAGVCNTDLEILQGYMGFTGVLGHEFVGIVEQVVVNKADDDTDDTDTNAAALQQEWIGKRVCGDINVACCDMDTCKVCRDADSNVGLHNGSCCSKMMARNHCPNRTVLGILKRNGCMAEYITLPIRNLHVVPDNVLDQTAVFAEPLAAACRIPEQGLINKGDKVAILGDGKLGLMIAEVVGRLYLDHCRERESESSGGGAASAEAYQRPIIFGKHQHKLDLVRQSGVETRLVSECRDQESTDGGHPTPSQHAGTFDVVIDATGSPGGLSLAASLCRPMGTLCLKSTCAAGEVFQAAPIVINELKVIGSRCGPIDKALELLGITHTCTTTANNSEEDSGGSTKKPLGVEKYITKTFTLAEAEEAIKCAAEKSTMKVQIICSER